MKRKYIYIFMQLFTSICLISVGFASWTFVSGDSITATGNIHAENIHMYIRPYEDTSTEGPDHYEVFRYCDSGFLNGTGEYYLDENGIQHEYQAVTQTGSLKYRYFIDLYECKTALEAAKKSNSSLNSFNIQFELSHPSILKDQSGSYEIITNYLTACTFTQSDGYTVNDNEKNTNKYILNLNFYNLVNSYDGSSTNANRNLYFEITYTFTYIKPETSNFYNDLYKCFIDEDFEFIMKINVDV